MNQSGIGFILVLFLYIVSAVTAETAEACKKHGDPCGTGKICHWQWGGAITCVQKDCPPGAGRNAKDQCSCWEQEWTGKDGKSLPQKETCHDEKGLATQCVPYTSVFFRSFCPESCPNGFIDKDGKCEIDKCSNDKKCKPYEKCDSSSHNCVAINCECGFIDATSASHSCKPYECCSDYMCKAENTICDISDPEKYPKPEHKCVPGENVCKLFYPDTETFKDIKERGEENNKLTLIIVPDHYDQKFLGEDLQFAGHGAASYHTLFNKEPYKTYKNKIKAYIVTKLGNVGCEYKAVTSTVSLTSCNREKVFAASARCPRSKSSNFVYVLTKLDPSRGAAHGDYAVASYDVQAGGHTYGLIHEASHLLGLYDEYLSYGGTAPAGVISGPNCDNDPSCNKWRDFSGIECAIGCTYNNWYRPIRKDTIMGGPLTEIGTEFDIVSKTHLQKELEKYS